jgi:transcriptional regulator GlxA family with amidase domain
MLSLFGAIPDPARVVRDGNILTGGGVTAGIDFALVVAAELAGEDFAQSVQLLLEYAPAPPFQAGRPEVAPSHILAIAQERMAAMIPSRLAGARAAADRLLANAG